MLQLIVSIIVFTSMSVIMHIDDNARTKTQEEYDNTDWNAYYANL